jgi:hypothetical protein
MIRRDPYREMMYHMRNSPVYLLWLVCGIALVTIVVFFFLWIVLLIGGILALASAFWAIGTRFEIKEG